MDGVGQQLQHAHGPITYTEKATQTSNDSKGEEGRRGERRGGKGRGGERKGRKGEEGYEQCVIKQSVAAMVGHERTYTTFDLVHMWIPHLIWYTCGTELTTLLHYMEPLPGYEVMEGKCSYLSATTSGGGQQNPCM